MRVDSTDHSGMIVARSVGFVDQADVSVKCLPDHSFDAEGGLYGTKCRGAKLRALGRIFQEFDDSRRQGVCIARWHEQARVFVRYDFRDAAGACCHDRLTCRHGLKQDRTHTFGDGTHGEDVEPFEEFWCVGAKPGE